MEILNKLFQKRKTETYDYQKEFKAAIKRNRSFKLEAPNIEFSNCRYFTQENLQKLSTKMNELFPSIDPEVIVGQCVNFHLICVDTIMDVLNTSACLTLGFIKISGEEKFKFTDDDIKDWLNGNINLEKQKLHAWLTLNSMEIIDLTLGTSLAVIYKNRNYLGTVLLKHPSELEDMEYHPMLLGHEVLIKAGLPQIFFC